MLFFRAADLPALGYKVYKFKKVGSASSAVKGKVLDVNKLGFEVRKKCSDMFLVISTISRFNFFMFQDRYVNFDSDTGLLKSITMNGVTLGVNQNMLFYKGSARMSGAYIFRPDTTYRDATEFGAVKTSILINDGNLVREVRQVWEDWVTQIIRIYKEEDFIEFDWVIGPIDME